jgi:SAM-dependent methyltransferase
MPRKNGAQLDGSSSDDVIRHYESMLAEHYTWMFGGSFADKVDEQRALLKSLGADTGPQRLALDLGCGPGFQSLALVSLGFARVLAVDTSRALLAELATHSSGQPVETIEADLTQVPQFAGPGSTDLIVCMGDTLTHLASFSTVTSLFRDAFTALAPGGRLVLTFRDLSTALTGLDRFIPVRSDETRVLTCFLEYEPEAVLVHDLLYVRDDQGWTFRKSQYRKLRLSPAHVAAALCDVGFEVVRDAPCGRLWATVAQKPRP